MTNSEILYDWEVITNCGLTGTLAATDTKCPEGGDPMGRPKRTKTRVRASNPKTALELAQIKCSHTCATCLMNMANLINDVQPA